MPPVPCAPPLDVDPPALLVPPEPEAPPVPVEPPDLDAQAAPTTTSATKNTDRKVDFMETSVECEGVRGRRQAQRRSEGSTALAADLRECA